MTSSRLAGIMMILLLASLGLAQDNDTRLLHIAAAKGEVAAVTDLLAKGVKVDAVSQYSTPPHHACANGHLAVVELLLAKGVLRG